MTTQTKTCELCDSKPCTLGGIAKDTWLCVPCDEFIESRLRLRDETGDDQTCDGCGDTRHGTEGHWECVGDDDQVLCPPCLAKHEDGDDGRPHCDDCDAWSMTTAHRHWTPDGEHMYCDDCADRHEDEFVEDETCAKCKGEFGEDCPLASTRDTTLCKDCYLNSHLDEDETDDEE